MEALGIFVQVQRYLDIWNLVSYLYNLKASEAIRKTRDHVSAWIPIVALSVLLYL